MVAAAVGVHPGKSTSDAVLALRLLPDMLHTLTGSRPLTLLTDKPYGKRFVELRFLRHCFSTQQIKLQRVQNQFCEFISRFKLIFFKILFYI